MKTCSRSNEFELSISNWNRTELARASFRTHQFPLHFHDTFVIQLVDDGVDRFVCEGKNYEAARGDLVVIYPGEIHSGQPASCDMLKYRAIYPSPAVIENLVGMADGIPPASKTVIRSNKRLAQKFDTLYQALWFGRPSLAIDELMIEFCNRLFQSGSSIARQRKSRKCRPTLLRAIDYLRANFTQNVSLNEMASESGLNKFHFLRVFKTEFGMTPHQYLLNCRLLEARRQLRNASDLTHVALNSGFSDQSHLNRWFKQHVGLTPGRYRNAHKMA